MKISRMAVYRYQLPLSSPRHLAGAVIETREGLLLQLMNEQGLAGWGEAAPLPGFSPETLEDALDDLHGIRARLSAYQGDWSSCTPLRKLSPSAGFAAESALLDLQARELGIMPCRVLNPNAAPCVLINRLLAGSPEAVLEQVHTYVRPPHAVKLKVGGANIGETAKLVRAIRELLPETKLRLDANRAWTLHEASAFYELIHPADIQYLEEPLRVPAELKSFFGRTGCPVALDETLREMEPSRLADYAFAAAIVIKPTLIGGVSSALAWAEAAHARGMSCVISAAYESGVGTLGLAHLAAAMPGSPEPAGLDTYHCLAADILATPLQFDDDRRELSLSGQDPEIDFHKLEQVI